jgi:acyl dehydratase
MLLDPSVIGSKSEPGWLEVEKGAIRAFANAIGDNNPLYMDEAFAKEHGFASLVAPPTFPTTFRIPPNPKVKFELARVLHGEQEYAYERPIVAGDQLRCVSTVVDVYERTGSMGAMTFMISEVRGEDLNGNLVYVGKGTIIIR